MRLGMFCEDTAMAGWQERLDELVEQALADYQLAFAAEAAFAGSPRLLDEFACSGDLWRRRRDAAAARAVQEKINELATAAALLSSLEPGQLLAYEPALTGSRKSIDFCVMSVGRPVAWIDVKTVSPEWRGPDFEPPRFDRAPEDPAQEVKMIRSRRRAGAGAASRELNARLTFLRRTIELEKKAAALVDRQRAPVAMLFCTNGFAWKSSALADFAHFYRTGSFRPDDSFGDAISKTVAGSGEIFAGTLAGFHCLERRQFDVVHSDFRKFVGGQVVVNERAPA